MTSRILILNGPNLNLLGTREPTIYGSSTLPSIISSLKQKVASRPVTIDDFQANHEGALVDKIQEARTTGVDFIVINPAAYTHTSVAIRDALTGVAIPFLELHLSNVHAREEWRKHSYFSDKAVGVICGLGEFGYEAAVEFAIKYLERQRKPKL
ncbi:type II 3-dehydroquinate dehydratase [Candidatus Bathyarchaeota archaeon]|nr:type II 3-dehydroquinate dehydratase [Candidatus Bathyarchaeota archaeon]